MENVTRIVALVATFSILLSGCGTPKSVADQACEAYDKGKFDLADSKFAKLIRDNYGVEEYKERRADLALVIRYEKGEIDEDGVDTVDDNVNFGYGSPIEAKYRLDYFCS